MKSIFISVLYCTILVLSNSILYSQEIIYKITGITGTAFIERISFPKTTRAFRGSQIHSDHKLKTENNTQIEVLISQNGNKIGNIIVYENSIIAVNTPINKKDNNKISLSLLEGYVKLDIDKKLDIETEIHTANTSTLVRGTEFEVAFSENGNSMIVLNEGSVDIVTDNEKNKLNNKEVYIQNINSNGIIMPQSVENSSKVFLNKNEEISRENTKYTIETLIDKMENLVYEDTAINDSKINNEDDIQNLELQSYRMFAANEGYYNSIVKLINYDEDKKVEYLSYARKSLTLYSANQRAINKYNMALMRVKDKFDRIRKKFDERIK